MKKKMTARQRVAKRGENVLAFAAVEMAMTRCGLMRILDAVAHVQGQGNVDDSQNREGIAEGPMDDVPHVKHLLGAGKEQNAFGKSGLFAGDIDGMLELHILGAA